MIGASDCHASVYELLDQILTTGTISPGSRGVLFEVIDIFRETRAPAEYLRQAERISIELHKLQWARQHQNDAATEAALAELRNIAGEWLNTRISGSC